MLSFRSLSTLIKNDDLEELQLILLRLHVASGGHFATKDIESGETLLHVATKNNRFETVKYLVQQCPSLVSNVDLSGRSPLLLACKTETSLEIVEILLPHATLIDINNALHRILCKNDVFDDHVLEILKLLLFYGGNLFHQCQSHLYLLKAIVCYNNVELVRLLVHNGVDPFENDLEAIKTSIMKDRSEILNYFLIQFPQIFTHLHEDEPLCEYLIQFCFDYNSYKCAIVLLKLDAVDSNVRHKKTGDTLLIAASKFNKLEHVKRFIEFEIDVNERNDQDKTALHYAVIRDNYKLEIVKLLLLRGANPHLGEYNEQGLLYYLISISNFELFKLVIDHSTINILEDGYEQTIFQYLCSTEPKDNCAYLFFLFLLIHKVVHRHDFPCFNKIKEHPLCLALRSQNLQLTSFLLITKLKTKNLFIRESLHAANNFHKLKLNLISFYLNVDYSVENVAFKREIFDELVKNGYSLKSVRGSIPPLTVLLWNMPSEKMNTCHSEFFNLFYSIFIKCNTNDSTLLQTKPNIGNKFVLPHANLIYNPPDALWIAFHKNNVLATVCLLRSWSQPPLALILFWFQRDVVTILPTSVLMMRLMGYGIPHGTDLIHRVHTCLHQGLRFESEHLRHRVIKRFNVLTASPSSLKQLSRFAVRKHYAEKYSERKLSRNIERRLPIPTTLSNYLNYAFLQVE